MNCSPVPGIDAIMIRTGGSVDFARRTRRVRSSEDDRDHRAGERESCLKHGVAPGIICEQWRRGEILERARHEVFELRRGDRIFYWKARRRRQRSARRLRAPKKRERNRLRHHRFEEQGGAGGFACRSEAGRRTNCAKRSRSLRTWSTGTRDCASPRRFPGATTRAARKLSVKVLQSVARSSKPSGVIAPRQDNRVTQLADEIVSRNRPVSDHRVGAVRDHDGLARPAWSARVSSTNARSASVISRLSLFIRRVVSISVSGRRETSRGSARIFCLP